MVWHDGKKEKPLRTGEYLAIVFYEENLYVIAVYNADTEKWICWDDCGSALTDEVLWWMDLPDMPKE